jgi:hypothetical protein
MDAAGVSIDLAAAKAHKVILVEGGRDKAAVEVLAGRRGQVLGAAGLHVAAIGCHQHRQLPCRARLGSIDQLFASLNQPQPGTARMILDDLWGAYGEWKASERGVPCRRMAVDGNARRVPFQQVSTLN